jgi:hypothetical protein
VVEYAEFGFEAFFASTIPSTKLVFTQPGSINIDLMPNCSVSYERFTKTF